MLESFAKYFRGWFLCTIDLELDAVNVRSSAFRADPDQSSACLTIFNRALPLFWLMCDLSM